MTTPVPDRQPLPPQQPDGAPQSPYGAPAYPPNAWPPQPAGYRPGVPLPYNRQGAAWQGPPPSYQPTPTPLPAPRVRRWNTETIVSVVVAVVGLVFSAVPLLRAMFGVAAVTLCVIGDVRARRDGLPGTKLPLVGGVIGVLEVTAVLF